MHSIYGHKQACLKDPPTYYLIKITLALLEADTHYMQFMQADRQKKLSNRSDISSSYGNAVDTCGLSRKHRLLPAQ